MEFHTILYLYFVYLPLLIGTIIGLVYWSRFKLSDQINQKIKPIMIVLFSINIMAFFIFFSGDTQSPYFTDHLSEFSTNYLLNLIASFISFIAVFLLFKKSKFKRINDTNQKASKVIIKVFGKLDFLLIIICLYFACKLTFEASLSSIFALIGFSNGIVCNYLYSTKQH